MNALKMSLRYIASRKLESSLAVIGIVLGVATLAGTLSLISGYETYYEKFSKSPESRQIGVLQSGRVHDTDNAAVLIGATASTHIQFSADEARGALAVCPDALSFYEAEYRTFATTASASSSGFGGPGDFGGTPPTGGPNPGGPIPDAGSPPAAADIVDTTIEKPVPETVSGGMVSGGFFAAWSLRAKYGDVFSDSGNNTGVPGVVIGAGLAGKLYAGITDPASLIGKKIILSKTAYVIIGVLEADPWNSSGRNVSFNEMAFVPTWNMRAGSANRTSYHNLSYTVTEKGSPARAAIELENYFNSIHGAGSVVAEANLDRFYRELTKRQRILTLMAILASASALTAAINLFNLMTSRVVRRRRPIAIMRAIGAWNMKVFGQIMIEAGLIGSFGSVCGIALSPLVVRVLGNMLENSSSAQSIPVSVNVPVLLMVATGALFISLLFAAIPAKNGSTLVISDALRSE